MRGPVLFLAALALGALTVAAQERDGDKELNEAIERVKKLLQQRTAARAAPQESFVVTRIYEIADLVEQIPNDYLEPSNLFLSKYGRREVEERDERGAIQVDAVIEMIRMIVAPSSWDTIEGASIEPKNSRLYVTNVARVHAGIERLLASLRASLLKQVVVDVEAVPVSAELAATLLERPRELSEEDLQKLAAVPRRGSTRLICFDDQQVVRQIGKIRSYVADYEVEIAENSSIGDPVSARIFEGFSAEVRACLDPLGGGALLHCRLDQSHFKDPTRKLDTEHGTVELPVLRLTRVNTSVWAPFGKTIVAGGSTAGPDPVVFLLTAYPVRS